MFTDCQDEIMDVANILQTAAAVLMPILAVLFKVYTDKQNLETNAKISESHINLIAHSDKNKKEVLGLMEHNKVDVNEQLSDIKEKLTVNIVEDKRRDADLKRQGKDIEKLKT